MRTCCCSIRCGSCWRCRSRSPCGAGGQRVGRGISRLRLAGLTVLALLAHMVMLSSQVNLAVIGLALPPALAIAWAATKQRARQPIATAMSINDWIRTQTD